MVEMLPQVEAVAISRYDQFLGGMLASIKRKKHLREWNVLSNGRCLDEFHMDKRCGALLDGPEAHSFRRLAQLHNYMREIHGSFLNKVQNIDIKILDAA